MVALSETLQDAEPISAIIPRMAEDSSGGKCRAAACELPFIGGALDTEAVRHERRGAKS